MNLYQSAPTLTDCDREPIHLIGAIQSFGALIAVNADWIVAHRSANVSDILGDACAVDIGDPLRNIFSDEAIKRLRAAVAGLFEPDSVERLFAIDLCGKGALFDCALHASGALIVLEIEPHEDGAIERGMGVLRPLLVHIEKAGDIRSMGDRACTMLRDLLGYDRVMLYRFRQDESGEVIAEAKREDLEPYLDLRYPRADIPQQARALFVRNRFRIIADIDAPPVPVEPSASLDSFSLDLSMSMLRSQSVIHHEYLRNMGVGASLSISVIVEGKLWGLFACHHTEPRLISYSMRTVAELFSEIVSLIIDRAVHAQSIKQRDAGRLLHDRLMRSFADGEALIQALPNLAPIVGKAIEFDGISVYIDGVYRALGDAPDETDFGRILRRLNAAPSGRLIVTEALAEMLPESKSFYPKAAGAIILPISKRPRDFLILWRNEELQSVTWAGDPNKAVADEQGRLSPRGSFAAWQESMHGRSREWSVQDVQLAEGLRTSLLEIILRLTEEQMQERKRSQQQQEMLIAELNHRVRNILNLIRGLISQSRGEATSIEQFSDIVGGRIASLASAHDNITKGNWSPAPLRTLIETELDAYVRGSADRVTITGPRVLIDPEAYTVLALVVHEMVTNSAKYGSLTDSRGVLEITISCEPDDAMKLHWREIGGPPVKPPQRRGFGSTIVERSIPFELGGEANVDYALEGLRATFVIPDKHITWLGEDDDQHETVVRKPADGDGAQLTGSVPSNALVVEDSIIIAMDTEDCLRELGVADIDVSSTVAGALASIEKRQPAFAILDYNLGSESSERVAEELHRRKVPFWLATGYGEMGERINELGARGLLTKPYGKNELTEVLAKLSA